MPPVTSAPHAFQITMPAVSAALTPPPASAPGKSVNFFVFLLLFQFDIDSTTISLLLLLLLL